MNTQLASTSPKFNTSPTGVYISLEGIDGCGKTTQAAAIVDAIQYKFPFKKVMVVREPGTTPASEYIRRILVTTGRPEMAALTELLLFTAARHEAMRDVILPELESGTIIVSDRCTDSTLVFQGSLGRDLILNQAHMACGGISPHLSIILDIPVSEAIRRTRSGNPEERHYEGVDESVVEDRRAKYMALVNENDKPWQRALVDATGAREGVTRRILRTIAMADIL